MDTSIAMWLNQQAQHDGLRQLAEAGARFLLLAPALIVAYLLIRSLLRRDAAALASLLVAGLGTAVALAVNMVATTIWFRARPYTALAEVHALVTPTTESSFFSDHTVAVTGLAVAALLVSRRWGIVAATTAGVMALARVAVGAHYPTDVLAAAAITTASIAVLLPVRAPLAPVLRHGLGRVSPLRPRHRHTAAPTSEDAG